jgi:transposase
MDLAVGICGVAFLKTDKKASGTYLRIAESYRDESGLDVVFFDVTTFYFDSDKEIEGELRQKGFSKDGKIGKTQVLFALLIDKNKQPIGYEIYRGDQFEGHCFVDAIERLKKLPKPCVNRSSNSIATIKNGS